MLFSECSEQQGCNRRSEGKIDKKSDEDVEDKPLSFYPNAGHTYFSRVKILPKAPHLFSSRFLTIYQNVF